MLLELDLTYFSLALIVENTVYFMISYENFIAKHHPRNILFEVMICRDQLSITHVFNFKGD
jgi:hypothetical protein